MPLYEYRCKKCGRVSEFLEQADSNKKHSCEHCGSRNMEKLFSAFSARASSGSAAGNSSSCPTGTCPLS